MRVLFQSRIDLFDRRGGDTVQMERTAQELNKLSVDVDIDCSPRKNLSQYDLVHLFNIDWPANVYLCARNAKKQGKPIVLSPIHHSFEEIERYEREYQFGLRRIVNLLFRGREQREKFKDFYRAVVDPKKIPSTIVEFKKGVMEEQRELLGMVHAVLVQTEAETADIVEDFGVCFSIAAGEAPGASRVLAPGARECGGRVYKVVNGVDQRFANAMPDWFIENYGWEDFVVCVGRVEPRKNQLAVIAAGFRLRERQVPSFSQGRDFQTPQLLFVGKISWRHPEYALRFKNLVRKYNWIKHIESIPYKKMGSVYAAANTHVSASWFETTGLVSLEAGLAGCNVVAAGDRARDYLGDFAFYCDPGKLDSVTKAISKAMQNKPSPLLKPHILENFTWDKTAEQTLAVYRTVLGVD
ncbi:MAG: glycosyltransferase [Patescibacteria group bacterium]|nr:glycosyltransferase [Patescibacteria group bacterium]